MQATTFLRRGYWPVLLVAVALLARVVSAQPAPPPAAQLYQPKAALSGPHPRYFLPGYPLSTLQAHWASADPTYQTIAKRVRDDADAYLHQKLPTPADLSMDGEDPQRGYALGLQPLLVTYKLTGDVKYFNGLMTWYAAIRDGDTDHGNKFALFHNDLPLSHWMTTVAMLYDWLYDDPRLPAATRTELRNYLVAMGNWMLDPANVSAQQWNNAQYLANHNWYNKSALLLNAAVLYGDPAVPQAKSWLDAAMVNFYFVRSGAATDGGTIEGMLYQGYGADALITYDVLVRQLLATTQTMFGSQDPFGKAPEARLHMLLPGFNGLYAYGDSYVHDAWSALSMLHYVARLNQDAQAALVAQFTLPHAHAGWFSLVFYDPAVPVADPASLPTSYDLNDIGIYLRRSSWPDPNASFFAFKCGPAKGKHSTDYFGFIPNGHVQPDEGNFAFYYNGQPIIPSFEYGTYKSAASQNLVLFDARDGQYGFRYRDASTPPPLGASQPLGIGQVGGENHYFRDVEYAALHAEPSVLAKLETPHYSSYLCEVGNIYNLRDNRAPGNYFRPTYRRSITYLPSGAVVIADKLSVPAGLARTFDFRLLTGAPDTLAVAGNTFTFRVGGHQGKIVDYTQQPVDARTVELGVQVSTFPGHQALLGRGVANIVIKNQTSAVFAVVLGVDGSEAPIRVAADTSAIVITGIPGEAQPLRLSWTGSAAPLATHATLAGAPGLALYPNPVRDYLEMAGLTALAGNGPVQATLTDVTGRLLRTTTVDAAGRLYVGDLPAGLYLLTLRRGGQQVTGKFVVAPR